MKVTIAHYGIGNLLSVRRAFVHLGADVNFAQTPQEIAQAERLVVPGVGAFKHCMDAVDAQNLRPALTSFAASGKPYLGICVGMQMLLDKSEEFGTHVGLGIIPGVVEKIAVAGERIPFIGWKKINFAKPSGLEGHSNTYYFVHSYHATPSNHAHLYANYTLANTKITAVIGQDNVMGVQFHPEKSGDAGLALLKKFTEL